MIYFECVSSLTFIKQSVKLHDARSDPRPRSQSVSVDKEAKLLCLDTPNECTKVLAWFEDTRDFVVTVAVLQKAGFTVQMGSAEELATPKSRSSSTSRSQNPENSTVSLHQENSLSLRLEGKGKEVRSQSPALDHAPHNRETSLSSLNPFNAAPLELSPWQLPLGSKANHTHSPRVSSPLRAPAPLVTPLSLDARGVSADPHPRVAHVPNFYRTVSVPVGIPHALHQGQLFSFGHNSTSQPLPQPISSPVTTSGCSYNEHGRREDNASPRNISDYKNEMPRPRSLPFSPESKRAKRKSPSKPPKQVEKVEMETAKGLPSPKSDRLKRVKKYKDSASNCDLLEVKKVTTVDSSTNTNSCITNNVNAATQTLPLHSQIDFIILMEDPDKGKILQQSISRLVEQYEADVSSGYNVPRYAEFYATQIEALQTEYWHSQLYPNR